MFLNIDDRFKKFLRLIYESASKQNQRLFIVGGAVRDYYLQVPVKDFDLILEGNALDFSSSLPPEIYVKSVHEDFGTVKLLFEDTEFDLASTREETYPHSGCLPVVSKIGVPVDRDVLRRDFTVNSLYFEVLDNFNFELIDLVNGVNDIKSKTLKVLHDKSYIDDPTRILRGVAFKHRFNFDFSEYDKRLIGEYILNIDYSDMSRDRAVSVFKIALNNKFGLNILEDILKNNFYKILTDKDITFNFDLIKDICSIFNLNTVQLGDFAEKIIKFDTILNCESKDKLSLFKNFSNCDIADLAYYYYKTLDNNVIWYLKNKDTKLNVKGADLLNLGYPQGKIIGEILDKLCLFKLNNPDCKMTFDDEINFVKSNFPI